MQQKACQFFHQTDKASIVQTPSHSTFCFSTAMKAKSSNVTNVLNIQFWRSFMNIRVGCDAWIGSCMLQFEISHECNMLLLC